MRTPRVRTLLSALAFLSLPAALDHAGVLPAGTSAGMPAAHAAPERYAVQDAWPGVTFDTPVAVAAPKDGSDRIFVVERAGVIKVGKKFRAGTPVAAPTVFLDIRHLQLKGEAYDTGQGGLLNMAFPPDFATSKEFFVFYAAGTGQANDPYRAVVAGYKVGANPNVADPASARIVLQVPKAGVLHFGGGLACGPDGTLYVGIGDSAEKDDPRQMGQDTRILEAKILRIDPRPGPQPGQAYGIPRDNPWPGGQGGVRPEIFAYGVRQPHRISVDAETGLVWYGDLGQKRKEEISVARRGGNMGWPVFEADLPLVPMRAGAKASDFVAPTFAYGRDGAVSGNCVIGGRVYRGQRCVALRGKYVFGDNGSVWKSDDSKGGMVFALPVTGDAASGPAEPIAECEDIVSVDEDAQGELYFSMFATGRVTTLVPAP